MTMVLMILAGLIVLALCLIGMILWLGNRDPGIRISKKKHVTFVALKGADSPLRLKSGVNILWESKGDIPLIGDEDRPYWDHFLVVETPDNNADNPLDGVNSGAEDTFIARLRMTNIPAFGPGLFRFLYLSGLRRSPKNVDINDDAFEKMARPDIMPSEERANALLDGPAADRPAMVNFLKYYDHARYDGGDSNRDGGTGAQAYNRYGMRAMESVYRVGGNLVFYGHVDQVIQDATHGPTREKWDDIAVMQYPNRKAILTMEAWDRYRDSFHHRDAGLDQTRLFSSYPDKI